MNYYRDLALALRGRRLGESEVLEALKEVRAYCAATGEKPTDAFGEPAVYAASFERKRGMTPGGFVLSVAVALAVCAAAAQIGVMALSQSEPLWGPVPVGLGMALMLCLVGLIVGFLVDHRLPAGFSPVERGERE